MADNEKISNSNDSLLRNWLTIAKEKTTQAIHFVQKDLTEFTNTVHTDTTKAANIVKETLKKEESTAILKNGVINLFSSIKSDNFDLNDNTATKTNTIFDQTKTRLSVLQLDENTYKQPIEDNNKFFETFLDNFDLDAKTKVISDLMVNQSGVRGLYTKLVPSELSHTVFWQRYFYRLSLLENDERRREELKKRADDVNLKDNLAWDDDDDVVLINSNDIHASGENIGNIDQENSTTNEAKKNATTCLIKQTKKLSNKKDSESSLDDDWDIDLNTEEIKKIEKEVSEIEIDVLEKNINKQACEIDDAEWE